MTKYEFLERLDQLLGDLPAEEHMDAKRYYEDYFADAGPENEEQVIKELGSPENVSEKIHADWNQAGMNWEFQKEEDIGWKNNGRESAPEIHTRSFVQPVAFSILLIFMLPIILPIVLGIFFMLAFLFLGFGFGGVAMVAGGVTVFGVGMANISFGAGMVMLLAGIGMILAAIGILFIIFAVNCAFRAIPAIARGCIAMIRWICGGRRVRNEAV